MKIKFIAQGCRWFDKVNGNTYCSVRITNTETGEMLYVPFQYGYGDFYRQVALTEMSKKGWLGAKYTDKNCYSYERENEYPIYWTVTDGLKRDCIANGRGN